MAEFIDYMVQHALYIKDMEKNIRDEKVCQHKSHTECDFGKLFHGTLKPNLDSYPESQRLLLERVEQVHRDFHEAAGKIQPDAPDLDAHRREASEYSFELLGLLEQLYLSAMHASPSSV